MKRKWIEFEEGVSYTPIERCFVLRNCYSTELLKKHLVIISHSDLDGVTSALNMIVFAEHMGWDYSVFMERTSRETETSKLVELALDKIKENGINYASIEVAITDRMFLDKWDYSNVSEDIEFTWYDHHSGNVVSKEECELRVGKERIRDYCVLTDIDHCGATISYERMINRLKEANIDTTDIQRRLRNWSYNVNLWDTFQWKKKYTPDSPQYHRGKKWGTIDKIVGDEKKLLRILLEYVDKGMSLDSDEVYSWVNDCNTKYQSLLDTEYKKSIDSEYARVVNIFSEKLDSFASQEEIAENTLYKIAIIPAEWKYASSIKERLMEERPDIDIVITYHETGGTVYTGYHITEVESPEIARFIGESYGLNGGGHTNAAGFGCRERKEILENPDENSKLGKLVTYYRICAAFTEFIAIKFKGVHGPWMEI